MEDVGLRLENAIGRTTNKDIFSSGGVLLIPSSTVVTFDHMMTLEKHGIALTEQDLNPAGTNAAASTYCKMVDESVEQVTLLFDEIRESKTVSLPKFQEDVLPIIYETTNDAFLSDIFSSLQAADDYTYRHNISVGIVSNFIGTWMGLEAEEISQLTTAALLHDVGKMFIPLEILNKPGKLTEEEFDVIKNHTVLGYDVLKQTAGITHRQAVVALQHHERMDGSGYPYGITGENIDLFSRIVAVADIFHAMTSNRVYRNSSPFYEVLSQMEQDSFTKLDPAISRLFIEKMMNSFIGHKVLLTDGREGTLILVHRHRLTRPLIKTGDTFLDLSQDLSLHIDRIY